MSSQGGYPTSGGWDRRELLSALARWTVPTIVTLSLATRTAQAAASCPPCTKRVSGACRACTMSQILNCQCEPCLGPPYCSSGSPTAPMLSRSQGTSPFATQQTPSADVLNALRRRRALMQQDDPFASPFARQRLRGSGDSIFRATPRSPYGSDPRSPATRGLYDRLRRPEDRP